MRVISGYLGGRNFLSPSGHRTHPMSDKMRGGLFSALGDISDLDVLDVYSGSGALAFEAASRGAKTVIAIEADKSAYGIIKQNIETLALEDKVEVTKAYFKSWSNRKRALMFDLILADPPYDYIVFKDIEKLPLHITAGGIMVLSWPGKEEIPEINSLDIIQNKTYGDSQLVFYRKIS
jgi:16S rRNA (guanine966-N2)-methyltransferase